MGQGLSGISRQHKMIRKNVFWGFCFIMLLFGVIIGRFAWLQLARSGELRTMGEALYKRDVTIPFTRGPLVDRNYIELAVDSQRHTLYVDPSLVQYPQFIADQLAPVINISQEKLLAELTYVTLKSRLSKETADKVRALNLPSIFISPEGLRLRIGVDWEKVESSKRLIDKLGKALNIPAKKLRSELGVSGDGPNPTGTCWLKETYPAASRPVITGLALPGLLCETFESFRVEADQMQFIEEYPAYSAAVFAAKLAPPLGVEQTRIEHLLKTRRRFAKIKTDLTNDELSSIQRMQSTMYVVQPGKLFDESIIKDTEVTQTVNEAVTRLHSMLNEKGQPEQVSTQKIRESLMPSAKPGVLGVKSGKGGKPDIEIPRRLYSKPIPGVIYGLPGTGIMEEPSRNYPFKSLASATLGWVGDQHTNPHGVFGLEEKYEAKLRGTNGREEKEIDAKRRTIPLRSRRTDPVNGLGVGLTIDLSIQQAAEEWLARYVTGPEGHAARGQCVVMDPNTGEILALATCPSWDANNPAKSTIPRVNPAVSNFYEPGSTFKIVAVMAALEEGLVKDGEIVTNCAGAFPIGNWTINEAHNSHGSVDCGRLLEQSCNIGAAKLALRLGPDKFLKWCEKLGFGAKTGIELGQESSGSLNRKNVKAQITLANMGFGQSLAVTPIQMATAYSVIANGGEWVQPHLVKRIQKPDGNWQELPPVPRRRVCSEKTAALMRGYLERVVTKGTGGLVSLEEYGYRVGGKTGTAQKAGPHGYQSGSYIGSFIGVMPIEHPQMVIITIIDEPKNGYYGGVVAGPVVKNVGLRSLQSLNIVPSLKVK